MEDPFLILKFGWDRHSQLNSPIALPCEPQLKFSEASPEKIDGGLQAASPRIKGGNDYQIQHLHVCVELDVGGALNHFGDVCIPDCIDLSLARALHLDWSLEHQVNHCF